MKGAQPYYKVQVLVSMHVSCPVYPYSDASALNNFVESKCAAQGIYRMNKNSLIKIQGAEGVHSSEPQKAHPTGELLL